MSDWKILPKELPFSGETVWVRINYWFGQPFKAVWNVLTETFTGVETGIEYPAWSVMRWKSQSALVLKMLGDTDIYGTAQGTERRRAQMVTFSEAGKIASISVYHAGGTGNLIFAIYENLETDLPGTRLAYTATVAANAAAGFQTVNLPSLYEVAAGAEIWIAWIFETNVGTRYGAGTPGRISTSQGWSSGMPEEFGSGDQANYRYSAYLSYWGVE